MLWVCCCWVEKKKKKGFVLELGFDCGCSLLLGGRFCDGRMVFCNELRFWWLKFFRDLGYEFLRMRVNFR
jgi:hypothetical protein